MRLPRHIACQQLTWLMLPYPRLDTCTSTMNGAARPQARTSRTSAFFFFSHRNNLMPSSVPTADVSTSAPTPPRLPMKVVRPLEDALHTGHEVGRGKNCAMVCTHCGMIAKGIAAPPSISMGI